ncbi:hypothetical protein BRADI_1g65348v3 [Brachypodium distachyon]|uniref:Uncharacterized protein n=1 Tax=Brachypodium distachyon TaxID=15368 RepID=A0A2K2DTH5_BRADI|nr:hypothetical protein BRADI_1g65348v3 [Brachypodium distachyon]PNT77578.1 hypothetical protein BRADI_1g65348v3 [Brachypodium distachyon]
MQISASSTTCSSPLQAEAWALLLAAFIKSSLNLQSGARLTDNLILAQAAASRYLQGLPGHWELRPLMNNIFNETQGSNVIRHVYLEIATLVSLFSF